MTKEFIGIVAIDENLGIGYENSILYSNSVDLKIFKSISSNLDSCIVGNTTYNSLPLKVRENRVFNIFTKNPTQKNHYNRIDNIPNGRHAVIGGSMIYNLFEKEISIWFVTIHKNKKDQVDTWLNEELYLNIILKRCLYIYEDKDILVKMYY